MIVLYKSLVFLRDGVAAIAGGSAATVRWLKEHSQQVWENTTIRKWPLTGVGIAIGIFERFERSLEDIRTVLRYRIHYVQVTGPMKEYYRKLKKQPRRHKQSLPV